MVLCRVVRKEVPKHETALFRGVSVEVYVDVEILVNVSVVHDSFLDGPDSWLVKLWLRSEGLGLPCLGSGRSDSDCRPSCQVCSTLVLRRQG